MRCSWCERFTTPPARTAPGGMRTRLALTCSTAWPLRCSAALHGAEGERGEGDGEGAGTQWERERRKR